MPERLEGTVVFFSDEKGYGFIKVPNQEKEIFVHYTGITTKTDNRRKLEKDQRVEFEIIHGKKGPQADNVVILG